MKKWLVSLSLLLLVGCESVLPAQNVNMNAQENNVDQASESTSKDMYNTVTIPKEQVHKGNLVLVNKEYPIHPDAIPADIVYLYENNELTQGYGLLDNTIQLSTNIAQIFGEMIQDADKDGVSHFMISSGYRDESEQEKLYEEKGGEYALPPGYSEHNIGFALDIGSTLESISTAPEGAWLQEHASEYGFILRYPEDKTDITGIMYEPWHFRYVGLPHSKIMDDKNLTLEEYLDFLKEQGNYTATIDGQNYQISFVPVSDHMTIEVPAQHQYELSGNNVDGVIVTIHQNEGEDVEVME
ncbi:M15 family metallopeptidase [Paenibacillus faecalis]|uniref:M15 family metallopeptidase n=1 Tax=Paenibacillus faecalis TaxID=2079532 RepID=UPI000D10EE1A|nr:M15 family metallopeptidase [Paenibacillus faecalis]